MKRDTSKNQTALSDEFMGQVLYKIDQLEKQQHINHEQVVNEFAKTLDFEKTTIAQIANSIHKMADKINALTIELEDKNKEINAYREGFGFRINKATFTELIKLYQFSKKDENPNYTGIIEDIFDINNIFPVEAYVGMIFDPKKHAIKGLHMTTNESEDGKIFKVISEGYYVSDQPDHNKILRYAEVIIYKMEDK